jgi:hypothetical protein
MCWTTPPKTKKKLTLKFIDMAQVTEIKYPNGDHGMEVHSKGRLIDKTTEGYRNKQEMIDSKVSAAKAILKKYALDLLK